LSELQSVDSVGRQLIEQRLSEVHIATYEAITRQQDVFRLYVAVRNALAMNVTKDL